VDLPANWICASLGQLIELTYGKGLARSERRTEGPVSVYGSNGIVGRTHEALTERPAIIVGRKGSAGALVVADGPSWTMDVAYYVVPPPYFEMRFLFLALRALDLPSLRKGVKPGLSRTDTDPLPLPVPPVAGQRRIIGKVDELMALCDELEAAQKDRDSRRNALRAASLHRLTAADGGGGGRRADVRFFLDRSERMVTRPEHVAEVRQAVLDLAVMGHLVPQFPGDEPACAAVQRIEGERARLRGKAASRRSRGAASLDFVAPGSSSGSRRRSSGLCEGFTRGIRPLRPCCRHVRQAREAESAVGMTTRSPADLLRPGSCYMVL